MKTVTVMTTAAVGSPVDTEAPSSAPPQYKANYAELFGIDNLLPGGFFQRPQTVEELARLI